MSTIKRQSMKRILFATIAIVTLVSGAAQQDAQYTHYMYNTLAVNPGYAGSRNALTFTALHRSQWIDFPGAPVTQTFTIHTPMFDNRLGLGISFVNDKLGPVKSTGATVDASYRLPLNDKSTLSFGIKAGAKNFRGEFSDIVVDDSGDNVFTVDEASALKPNFGIGIYYQRERFYAGLSSPGLLENSYKSLSGNDIQTSFLDGARHFYYIMGGVVDLRQDFKFKPTGLLKMTSGAPMILDVTGLLIIRERLELGLMYRTADSAGLLAGFNLNEQLHMGYSFDWSTTNATAKYNSGSHELMVRYDFIYKGRKKIKSPRYF